MNPFLVSFAQTSLPLLEHDPLGRWTDGIHDLIPSRGGCRKGDMPSHHHTLDLHAVVVVIDVNLAITRRDARYGYDEERNPVERVRGISPAP